MKTKISRFPPLRFVAVAMLAALNVQTSIVSAQVITFTNPTPAVSEYFGRSVAAVGADRMLIGAFHDDTGAGDAGPAYLFNTNGGLLTTFTNPAPFASDYFGFSVAAAGTDRVLIGAYGANTGAIDAGAAYLFSLAAQTSGAPPLFIGDSGNTVMVFWQNIGNWTLQQNGDLTNPNSWSVNSNWTTTNGTNYLNVVNPTGNWFFRLRQ